MTEVRTRFAPSPTGMLHIGGFRTAVYSWLLAKSQGGKFLLRIEDTDRERLVPNAIRYILEGFQWFGIDIDEGPSVEELQQIGEDPGDLPAPGGEYGPYVQSLRLEKYQSIADKLVDLGVAFRCDCTPEMLDQEREKQREAGEVSGYGGRCRDRAVSTEVSHVVRFAMPEQPDVSIVDSIRGEISWESVPLRDPVILKSDGFPTYHLACVVDDHEMKISHVMRAEEWIPSTPLHVLIYRALEWELPIFCHLPVVLGDDGKKLSKRHGATSWSTFREDGYLPEAVLNYMALVGWSPGEGDEQEIFSREELIQRFSIDRVNSSSAVFDYQKLGWMNGMYIRELSLEKFSEYALPVLAASGVSINESCWAILAPHIQERVRTLNEVPDMLSFVEDRPVERDLTLMFSKKLNAEQAQQVLQQVVAVLEQIEDFRAAEIEPQLKALPEKLGMKIGPIFISTRIALTGKKGALPLFESLEAAGKELCLRRLRETIDELGAILPAVQQP